MLDIKLKFRPGHSSQRRWMKPSPLKQLMWNVTYACNYRCPICFTNAGEAHRDELTTEEATRLIRNAAKAGVRDIIVSGGEPFMRPDIVTLLKTMAANGITARIATNGSLLPRDLLKRLRDETRTRSFQVSLETLDPDLYGRLHGTDGDRLKTVLTALSDMQQLGFHTTVSARVTPATLPRLPGLMDRCVAEGWATFTLHCPVHTRRVGGALPQTADILSRLEPALAHFAALPEKWLAETYIPWAPYHPAMKRLATRVTVVHRGCAAGRDRLSIHPGGDVSPCICLDVPEAYVGNVRKADLRALFSDAPICEMLRFPREHGICADCPNVSECGGGCRAAALAVTGRLDGPDQSCPVWQARQAGVAAGHVR